MRKLFAADILLMVTLTLLTIIFVLIPPLNQTFIRTILGLLLALFIPGYSLTAALFPKKNDLSGLERLALSFGLSIMLIPLIGLLLNYTTYGIRLTPILLSLSAITLFLSAVAYIRRIKTPTENQFQVNFIKLFKSLKGDFSGSKKEKILSLILIISILVAISSTVYIMVKPKEGEKFTEFYILGPDGKASNYPTNLTPTENGTVIIGLVNHESTPKTYRVVTTYNGTVMDELTVNLENNEKKEIPYTFTAGSPGAKKIEFLLFRLPDNNNVYRSLYIWINVIGDTTESENINGEG